MENIAPRARSRWRRQIGNFVECPRISIFPENITGRATSPVENAGFSRATVFFDRKRASPLFFFFHPGNAPSLTFTGYWRAVRSGMPGVANGNRKSHSSYSDNNINPISIRVRILPCTLAKWFDSPTRCDGENGNAKRTFVTSVTSGSSPWVCRVTQVYEYITHTMTYLLNIFTFEEI